MTQRLVTITACLALAACSGGSGANDSEPDNAAVENIAVRASWPDSLQPFGDGFPRAGDACRRVGESAATSNYLDDSADLVGCPTTAAATALGGKVVGTVEGITLVSVPRGAAGSASDESGDALVAGTDFNATTEIPCGANGKIDASCKAGVKRKWDDKGGALVEVTKADGMKRAIFFDSAGKAYGADGSQADGSAGWTFKATRDDDWTIITYGPERYRVPDALVMGG